MRKVLLVLVAFAFVGCSRYLIRDTMQYDKSYKIEVDGNVFASTSEAGSLAFERADGLCPKGWEKLAEIPTESFYPQLELIIMCKSK